MIRRRSLCRISFLSGDFQVETQGYSVFIRIFPAATQDTMEEALAMAQGGRADAGRTSPRPTTHLPQALALEKDQFAPFDKLAYDKKIQ